MFCEPERFFQKSCENGSRIFIKSVRQAGSAAGSGYHLFESMSSSKAVPKGIQKIVPDQFNLEYFLISHDRRTVQFQIAG